ncbi:MAG: twin-arginine translocation signal domain-containing protein, partial [Deltaproteobacteria bacterium]|nr:twin-arginine translocation signal domain-containing protein [Deltaproteobacteria bacterium]
MGSQVTRREFIRRSSLIGGVAVMGMRTGAAETAMPT